MSNIIVDTGPLVALLVRTDAHHERVVQCCRELSAPFLTCEPVLTETFYLLARLHDGPRKFFELLESDLLNVEFDLVAEREPLRKLIQKYSNLPMALADACLVRMAELNPKASIFTLDKHFRTYRKNGRQLIPLIAP